MKRITAAAGKRLTKTDLAAIGAFLLLAGALIVAAHTAWVSEDEYFYYAIAQRFANGDKPFLDEWSFIQLTGLLLSLPFRLFTAVTGGTDGVALFMRYCYIAVDLAAYWFCYAMLKGKKLPAVIAAALFCAHPLAGVLALNYYNVCLFVCAAILLGLLYSKKPLPRRKLLAAGAAYALAVVCEPVFIAVYPGFCLAALMLRLIRKKNPGTGVSRIPLGRVWFWISVGGGAVAALLLAFLGATTGLGRILKTLPLISGANPYQTSFTELMRGKFTYLAEKFGTVNCVLLPLTALAAAAVGPAFREKRTGRYLRPAVFFLAAAAVVSCYVAAFRRTDPIRGLETFFRSGAFPAFFFAPVGLCLCKKRDGKLLFVWLAALLFSLPMDLTSNFTLLACGTLAYFPAVCGAWSFLRELREDLAAGRDRRVSKRAAFSAALAAVCTVLLCECAALTAQLDFSFVLNRFSDAPVAVCRTGPGKGVYEPADRLAHAEAIQNDLERIRSVSDGPLYAALESSYCYLTAQMPVGSWTPLFHEDDLTRRALAYWNVRPENLPAYFYIAYSEEDETAAPETLRQVRSLCACSVEEGGAGYIVRVLDWKTAFTEELQ
ncbi:MAG: hypothetical protein IJL26_00355 [Clostridia bacterium]|nr:hypothetical protein [Clostridia bacterium]